MASWYYKKEAQKVLPKGQLIPLRNCKPLAWDSSTRTKLKSAVLKRDLTLGELMHKYQTSTWASKLGGLFTMNKYKNTFAVEPMQ